MFPSAFFDDIGVYVVGKADFLISDAPFKKGWAVLSRKQFLESQFPRFLSARAISPHKGTEMGDQIVNAYFSQFHWSWPVNMDPPAGAVIPDDNDLSQEDLELKARVITKMKKVCGQFKYLVCG